MNRLKYSVFVCFAMTGLYGKAGGISTQTLDTAVYSGTYSEKNLLFQNVLFQNDYSKGYTTCITMVIVNGKAMSEAVTGKSVEVDFKKFNLKKGDKVIVKVIHKKNCTFKCLNEEVLHNGKSLR